MGVVVSFDGGRGSSGAPACRFVDDSVREEEEDATGSGRVGEVILLESSGGGTVLLIFSSRG